MVSLHLAWCKFSQRQRIDCVGKVQRNNCILYSFLFLKVALKVNTDSLFGVAVGNRKNASAVKNVLKSRVIFREFSNITSSVNP